MSESARYRGNDLYRFCCAALRALEMTDANRVLAGPVLAFGRTKGSAISFIMDILCGVLRGSRIAPNLHRPEDLAAELELGHVFGKSLCLEFPNDATDLAETPA